MRLGRPVCRTGKSPNPNSVPTGKPSPHQRFVSCLSVWQQEAGCGGIEAGLLTLLHPDTPRSPRTTRCHRVGTAPAEQDESGK